MSNSEQLPKSKFDPILKAVADMFKEERGKTDGQIADLNQAVEAAKQSGQVGHLKSVVANIVSANTQAVNDHLDRIMIDKSEHVGGPISKTVQTVLDGQNARHG